MNACNRPTALLLFALLTLSAPARAERFYLSTDGISPPGEEPQLGVEAEGLSEVGLRVYRVADPEAFLLAQRDLHRPVTKNTLRRRHLFDAFAAARAEFVGQVRGQLREALAIGIRSEARDAVAPVTRAMDAAAKVEPSRQTRIGLLPGLPLIARWRQSLAAKGLDAHLTPHGLDGVDDSAGGEFAEPGRGAWSYARVGLGVREPGVYLVEGVAGSDVGTTLAVVSRLGLWVKQAADRTVAFVVDQKSGRPVAGATVTLHAEGKRLAQGQTDADGLFSWQGATPPRTVVLARSGDDLALIDPAFHSSSPADEVGLLVSDRPVYRPGHVVQFKGLLRHRTATGWTVREGKQAVVRLLDPAGAVIDTATLPITRGAFDGSFRLPEKSALPPLGLWRLSAEVDGQDTFDGEIRVKEFTKPEFRLRLAFDKPAYRVGADVTARLEVERFSGGKVKSGEVQFTVTRSRFFAPEAQDEEAGSFVSEAERESAVRQLVKEANVPLVGGLSQLVFTTPKDADDFTYVVEARFREESGKVQSVSRAVEVAVGEFQLTARPSSLVARPGEEIRFVLRATDAAGKPVATKVTGHLHGSRLEGGKEVAVDVDTGPIDVPATTKGGSWSWKGAVAGAHVATFTAKDSSGATLLGTAPVFVSAGGDLPPSGDGIALFSARPSHAIGQEASVLIRTPFEKGSVLVTHETASGLVLTKVLSIEGYAAVHRFPIPAEARGAMQVGAAATVGGKSWSRELALRVPPRDVMLDVKVTPDAPSHGPGEDGTFAIAVTDAAGKPVANAEVVLSVVDEAIYAVAPESVPPLVEFFWPQPRNAVRGSSSSTLRFYGYGRNVKDELASITFRPEHTFGDAKALARRVRQKFEDTLLFSPRLLTDGEGKATAKVTFPDNLTAWRATARAITATTQVGSGTAEVKVDQPLQVRIAAPRFFRERDRVTLAVVVESRRAGAGEVEVKLEATGLTLTTASQKVQVEAGGEALVRFEASVPAGTEPVKLTAMATLGGASDGETFSVPKLPWGAEFTIAQSATLMEGEPAATLALVLPEGSERGSLEVKASSGIAPAIESALSYLVGYPYGCTEQTMSRFVPDLIALQAHERLHIEPPQGRKEVEKMVAVGLARLRQLQHGDGGWGWWPEDPSDPWMTAWVVQGLALAKKGGFDVPEEMFSAGVGSLTRFASREKSEGQRALLLHALVLAGVQMDSMLDPLAAKARDGKLSPYAQSLVALTLHERGRAEAASELARSLASRGRATGSRVAMSDGDATPWWQLANLTPARMGWEQDPVEASAIALLALGRISPDAPTIDGLVAWLMDQRLDDHWQSTRDTGLVVAALVEVLPRFLAKSASIAVAGKVDGTALAGTTLGDKELLAADATVGKVPLTPGAHAIELSRSGTGPALHLQALARAFDVRDVLPASSNGPFAVKRTVWRLSGDTATPVTGAVPLDAPLLIELEVTSSQPLAFVQLSDPLGTGMEVEEQDSGKRPRGIDLHAPGVHREVRDEAVNLFIKSVPKGSSRYGYLVTPQLVGEVSLLPSEAQLMYHPQIRARSASMKLAVGGAQ